jgi:CheY-like chemotaxis protein
MDARPSPSDRKTWERHYQKVLEVLPYALLAGPTLLSLIQPDQTWADRLVIVGLVVLAAAWVLTMYSLRPPSFRQRTGAMVVSFAGMLGLAALLTARSWFFVAFAVTGLVQAFLLLPAALAFVGVAATSVVIYTVPGGFPEPTVEAVSGWVFIICLQTVLTGFFSFMGIKMMEEDQQRRELVARLEAALDENARVARPAAEPGSRGRGAGRATAHGPRDSRHPGPRAHRHRHPARGHRTGQPASRAVASSPGPGRALARDSLTEARRSVQALRPEPLEEAGLPDAIAHMAERWSETSSVELSFATTGGPRPLLGELEMTWFRVAQEALANVAKHAGASKVGLTLSYMDDAVLLDVRDDGVGFTAEPNGGNGRARDGQGFGLDRDAATPAPGRRQPGDRERSRRGHRRQRPRPCDRGRGQPVNTARGPIRLLLVDDHPVVRDGLRGVFADDPDFEVVGEAGNGAEAVARVEHAGADVVLMDLRMPQMSGVEAIQRLRERAPSVRVLVLTTYDTDSDVLPAIEAGRPGTCSRTRQGRS